VRTQRYDPLYKLCGGKGESVRIVVEKEELKREKKKKVRLIFFYILYKNIENVSYNSFSPLFCELVWLAVAGSYW
jgi:hypothetical protein